MIRLVYGQDELVRKWVSKELGFTVGDDKSVGVAIADEEELIGGIVWTNYYPMVPMIEINLATTTPKWCNTRILSEMFDYPFNQLKVGRVQATCEKKNKNIRRVLDGVGFTFEGVARKAFPGRKDAFIYSLLKHECRYI